MEPHLLPRYFLESSWLKAESRPRFPHRRTFYFRVDRVEGSGAIPATRETLPERIEMATPSQDLVSARKTRTYACPVDCIYPKKDEAGYGDPTQLFIDLVECIDCGACVPACPVSAIFRLGRRFAGKVGALLGEDLRTSGARRLGSTTSSVWKAHPASAGCAFLRAGSCGGSAVGPPIVHLLELLDKCSLLPRVPGNLDAGLGCKNASRCGKAASGVARYKIQAGDLKIGANVAGGIGTLEPTKCVARPTFVAVDGADVVGGAWNAATAGTFIPVHGQISVRLDSNNLR